MSYFSESRVHSPLATALPLLSRRPSASTSGSTNGEESESDKEKMSTDSPPLSDSSNPTPLLLPPSIGLESESSGRVKPTQRPRSPTTPPPRNGTPISIPGSSQDIVLRRSPRRPSHPVSTYREFFHDLIDADYYKVKMPRILTLLSESRPEENEVKSEAQFQRLLASCSALPTQPRTPRAASDRGRYPEEADSDDNFVREETPSDDEDEELDESTPFAFEPLPSSAAAVAAAIPAGPSKSTTRVPTRVSTPAQSVNGDDLGMLDSPGAVAMDVDVVCQIAVLPFAVV